MQSFWYVFLGHKCWHWHEQRLASPNHHQPYQHRRMHISNALGKTPCRPFSVRWLGTLCFDHKVQWNMKFHMDVHPQNFILKTLGHHWWLPAVVQKHASYDKLYQVNSLSSVTRQQRGRATGGPAPPRKASQHAPVFIVVPYGNENDSNKKAGGDFSSSTFLFVFRQDLRLRWNRENIAAAQS